MAELKAQLGETLQRLKKDKKALLTVAIGVIGMLLVLLSELPGTDSSTVKNDDASPGKYYNDDLVRQTEKLISQIEGAGRVSVMLTYEATEETVWAKDVNEKSEGKGGADTEEKYIIVDTSDGESGLAIKVIYPRIRGVAVVCSGGDNPVVNSRIKSLVSALFDIGSNRISIARRAEEE